MSDEINYQNNPLNGVGLKKMLEEIVAQYGFDILFAYLSINCFKTNASIESSFKFLKKTQWAREKVEAFYLYQYKSLPRASAKQFELPPRDRIIPDDQVPGEPKVLCVEDGLRMQENRAKKASEYKPKKNQNSRFKERNGGSKNTQSRKPSPYSSSRSETRTSSKPKEQSDTSSSDDPWANWR